MSNTPKALDSLPRVSHAQLRSLWAEVFGRPLDSPLKKDMLIKCLAYRLQEQAHGGLRPSTVKRLEHLLRSLVEGERMPASMDVPRFKPGTRLMREWQGKTFEVTVLDQGYAYRGECYASLSEIARAITGARWSGPRFFGLKKTPANAREASDGR